MILLSLSWCSFSPLYFALTDLQSMGPLQRWQSSADYPDNAERDYM